MSRRDAVRDCLSVVALLGSAGALSGCSRVFDALHDLPRPAPHKRSANEDQPLLDSARADQEHVLAVCLAVAARHHHLTTTMRPLIAHHRTHVTVLGAGEVADSSSTPAPPTAPPRIRVPKKSRVALTLVRDTEHSASSARAADALDAASGEFARVLAAIAASNAQHVVVLHHALEESKK